MEMEGKENLPIVALIYDFDGTLSPGNMQEYSFIGAVGMEKEEFWAETAVMAENQDSDNVLVYMLLMLEKAKQTGKPIREESFREFGKSVELFNGVQEWFKRINEYGLEHGIKDPNPGIELWSSALQADALPSEPLGKPLEQ